MTFIWKGLNGAVYSQVTGLIVDIELSSSDVDPLVTAEGEREVEPHVTVDTDVLLLQVGLLVRLLVLQAAVAQVTVVALEKLQPLKPSL